MKETEVKIYDIDAVAMRKRLAALGAKPVKNVLQRNVYYANSYSIAHSVKVRLRQEGEESIFAVKVMRHRGTFKTEDEYELQVDKKIAHNMITAMGFQIADEIEVKREYFTLLNCSVEICQLPRVSPYLEIEGAKHDIHKTLATLGFEEKQLAKIGPRKHYRMKGKKWVF